MTSELRVDNLKGSTTGGSINVLGEGTSATTNLQQGLLKCWANIDMANNLINGSFNLSGTTDNGTGRSELAFSNNFNNNDYAGTGLNKDGSGYNDLANIACDYSGAMSTSAFEVFTTHGGASANSASGNDTEFALVMVAGDLA